MSWSRRSASAQVRNSEPGRERRPRARRGGLVAGSELDQQSRRAQARQRRRRARVRRYAMRKRLHRRRGERRLDESVDAVLGSLLNRAWLMLRGRSGGIARPALAGQGRRVQARSAGPRSLTGEGGSRAGRLAAAGNARLLHATSAGIRPGGARRIRRPRQRQHPHDRQDGNREGSKVVAWLGHVEVAKERALPPANRLILTL